MIMDKEEPKNNIVHLPDNLQFWICALCRVNIQASMKGSSSNGFPMVVSSHDSADNKETRMVFCAACVQSRPREIDQHVSTAILGKNAKPSLAPSQTYLKDKRWKVYESVNTNSEGERLRVTTWSTENSGILATVTLSTPSTDRLICYNATGISRPEFELSLKYIRTQYFEEFGSLREVENHKRDKVTAVRFPLFRFYLIGAKREFHVYEERSSIDISLGNCLIDLTKSEFVDFTEVLSASSSFLQIGSATSLKKFKAKNKSSSIWSKQYPNLLVQTTLSENKELSVTKKGLLYSIKIGNASLILDGFDVVDLGKTLELFPQILGEKSVAQKRKSLDLLREDRFARIGSYIPLSYDLIMKDMSWTFDLAETVGF